MSKPTKDEYSSLSCTSSSLSSDEEVDARDLKPIKNYLSNRKELARQLFKSVKPQKLRMMLPQVLKQMDLNELEQWCVNELSGMSKSRILSVLNGKPLLESSDTSESDDSGPSLEIISDTEEWLTDDNVSKKGDDGKIKPKKDKTKITRKAKVNKKNDVDKCNTKAKCNNTNEISDKNKDIKIKKEEDKEKGGDSLLDLLELEMRARAIRALIRKEEDIIPCANSAQANNSQINEDSIKSLPENDSKMRENSKRVINTKQGNIGEDEDVVLVVQPTPVVELLSSDSDVEDHGGKRVNQKFENERMSVSGKSVINSDKNVKNPNKIKTQNSKTKREIQEVIRAHSSSNIVPKMDLSTKNEAKTMPERNVDIKNNVLSISISADNIAEKRKKSKKKSRTKFTGTHNIDTDLPRIKQVNTTTIIQQSNDVTNTSTCNRSRTSPISEEKKIVPALQTNAEENIIREKRIENERSADLDEIIDLDDYCDDIEIENCDEDRSQNRNIISSQQENKQSVSQVTIIPQKSDSSETWASRYYQTDDVQNVIKESKIQSEIRKRLRERQRLSKLSKSPNLNISSQSLATNVTNTTSEKTPTGSVEEYLALKRVMNASNASNDNNNMNATQENSVIIDSTNDVNTIENVIHDESTSCIKNAESESNAKQIVISATIGTECEKIVDTEK